MDFIVSLLLFAVPAAFTPGPNNIMIMSSGLNFGVRRSLPHLCGIAFGFPTMLLAIALGAGYIFERYPFLHEVIKVVGLAYLVYLAWRIAISTPGGSVVGRDKPFSFIEAMLFQWVNPKAWIICTSAVATFTSIGDGIDKQVAIIMAVFFMVGWPSGGLWLVFGSKLQRILRKPLHNRVFNVTMALLLLASVSGVIVELMKRYVIWY